MKTILTAVLTFFVGASCLAQDVARMDQIVATYVPRQFMGAVLVARGADVVFSKGYGSANLEWNIPNTPTTKFRLGSLTKQFTAASILLLEERGKLKVEDPVKKYLPDAPAAWDAITIFNLLTHSSGIPNFTSFSDYALSAPFPTTAAKLVARFRDKPLDFPPGEKMSYSNSGYVLLGHLIETITGASYEKFVQDNIFTPLNMKNSGYDSNAAIIARRAAGYAPGPGGPVNAGFVHMSIPFAAGALYSTTEDLLRWEQDLFGSKLLSPASLQKMTTPFKNEYAFGVLARTMNGRKQIWHNGGIDGFNTVLAYYPEDKLTVAVLGNVNGAVPEEIAAKIETLVHGGTVLLTSERKEITVPAATLAQYVGTYELVPGINMMITLDGGQLLGQLTGQAKFPLFAESESAFFLKVVDAQIGFARDERGTVTHLVLHQNGRDQKALRKSDTVLERKEVAVSATTLAAYIGTYEVRPGLEFIVTLDSDHLMVQAPGQPKAPLFAESDTSFFLKVIDAQMEFGKDETGAVKYMTLHQAGRDVKATRK